MTRLYLLDALGDVRSDFVLEAQALRAGKQRRKAAPRRRLLLIAAVIGLSLLLVGCAVAYALHLKDLSLGTYEPLFDKAMSNVVEVQARGARVLALTTETHREAMLARTDRVLTVPEVEPMLLPQLGVAPLQLLAYYIALERGCDIDKPRNLAKSVTVE